MNLLPVSFRAAALRRLVVALLAGLAIAVGVTAGIDETSAQPAPTAPRAASQHLETGFPLTGSHETTRCESCHVRGLFKGTPKLCDGCHGPGSRISSVTMPTSHPPTSQACAVCHNTVTFSNARFVHVGVGPGTCAACHNGTIAAGKRANHVVTSASCDSCHRTTAWMGARFDHSQVRAGTCASCHNGVTSTGKPANHVATSATCDNCHRATGWIPASFTHAGIAAGTCVLVPRRHDGQGQAGDPPADDGVVRPAATARPAGFRRRSITAA